MLHEAGQDMEKIISALYKRQMLFLDVLLGLQVNKY
jgi:hypothetical protein